MSETRHERTLGVLQKPDIAFDAWAAGLAGPKFESRLCLIDYNGLWVAHIGNRR